MFWLLLIDTAQALYVPLVPPNGSPWMSTAHGQAEWHTGLTGALLETSQGLRVGPRGLHFYEHSVATEHSVACTRVGSALCQLADGSLVLPTSSPRFSAGMGECDGWGRTLVTGHIYDISMCDIEAGLTLVWVADQGGLLRVQHNMGMGPWYVLTALIVLFLVVSLGQNVARITGDRAAATHPVLTEALCLVQCAVLLLQCNPLHVFLTHQDRLILLAFNLYVFLYLIRHCFELVLEAHVFTLNVITGTLVLVTARLYGSFETPYAPIFTFLLLTRMWHKVIHHKGAKLTTAMDVLVIALYWRGALRPSFWDDRVADIYGVAMVYVCYCIGLVTQPGSEDLPQPKGATQLTYHTDLPTLRTHCSDIGHNPRLNLLHRCAI
jgi:hypothetical protein